MTAPASSHTPPIDSRAVMRRAQSLFKPYFGKKGAQTVFRLAVEKKLGRPIPQQTFWKWVNRVKMIPPDVARAVQRATRGKVKAWEIRPDAFRRHGNAK